MLKQFVSGRVYVFIDAANILYSQQTLKWRVDYERLRSYLKRECDLGALYFYTGNVGDNVKQQSFLSKLRSLGYNVFAKEVKRIRVGDGTYILKGNLDVELAIDAILNLDHYDTMILMSGDSDFAYLLDVVKSKRKRTIVLSAKHHVSLELLQRAKYVNVRNLQSDIEFKKSPRPKPGRGMTSSV